MPAVWEAPRRVGFKTGFWTGGSPFLIASADGRSVVTSRRPDTADRGLLFAKWAGPGQGEAVAGATRNKVAVQAEDGLGRVRAAGGEEIPLAAQLLGEFGGAQSATWPR